jgi:hypothetical protein
VYELALQLYYPQDAAARGCLLIGTAATEAPRDDAVRQQLGDALRGFAVAGEDGRFVWAEAKIDGEDILVSSPEITAPRSARYGWADNPDVNLYNKAGLPASPFRTDFPKQ